MSTLFRSLPSQPLDAPIRAELFGAERLEQHAESLARAQPVRTDRSWTRPLLARVRDNEAALREAYLVLAGAVRAGETITPAAEWLIENFHVIDEQLREIRDDLPPGFYRKLPKLSEGPLEGDPRVYGIAWALVAHTDSRIDPDLLRRFVQAYQRVAPLTIGELWALAITLRIVLVENLRRLADDILAARELHHAAERTADDLLGLGDSSPAAAMAELVAADQHPLGRAFAVRLIERFRDHDPTANPVLPWLHGRLTASGSSPDATVQVELQWQAAATVTARNVITSMRLMSAIAWAEFFESVSLVDAVLRGETNFAAMDFRSRDSYRHAIEELAERSTHDELAVARRVIARTVAHPPAAAQIGEDATDVSAERRADPGFYLVGPGRREFERELGYRPRLAQWVLRLYVRGATPGYLGTLALLTAAIVIVPLLLADRAGAARWVLVVLGGLGLLPASDLAIGVINRWVTAVVPPRLHPRLELRDGIPSTFRTMVVVPTLLTDPLDIVELIDRLETHYLANPEVEVTFALLTDWVDAPTASMPTDAATVEIARAGLERLNAQYGGVSGGGDRFLLLHRQRRWNPREEVWMGWERKRGKLRELNHLLRGATDTSFNAPDGTVPRVPSRVRYVIALDADTRMPMGTVCRLVGTIAHPLNRPAFDPVRRRVVEGYGVLQPRIVPPLPLGRGSLLQRIASGPGGIDPYATAVSDVYQDLFDEGSYTGKGIYDVDAFEAALGTRVPENVMLSHDLFEGIFVRTGLTTDIDLFEAAPSNYLAAAARQHRWARGDWQLLPWVFNRSMPLIAWWKIVDNLRRTLAPPASFLILAVGWIAPAAGPVGWTALVLLSLALPAFLPTVMGVLPARQGASKRSHARAVTRDFAQGTAQFALSITMLADQAWLMGDAIVRTLFRLLISRRHLLEWLTAAQAASSQRLQLRRFVGAMAGAIVLAVIVGVLVIEFQPGVTVLAAPLISLWAISPWLAHEISVPAPVVPVAPLSRRDRRDLRLIARRTWRFFDRFVTEQEHFLPPDNFQETPAPVVARRTSPTNIGVYLLSAIAAHDFGWIGIMELVDRLEQTLDSMRSLERLHGHLFNWYATDDKRPLEPRYLSSVDSGNLAGALLTVAGACRELLERPTLNPAAFSGFSDTAILWQQALEEDAVAAAPHAAQRTALRTVIDPDDPAPRTPARWATQFATTESAAQRAAGLAEPAQDGNGPGAEALGAQLLRGCASHARDLDTLVPWARYAAAGTLSLRGIVGLTMPPLGDAARAATTLAAQLAAPEHAGNADATTHPGDLTDAATTLANASAACEALVARVEAVAVRAREFVNAMDFRVLFDPRRKLFAIGLRVGDNTLDSGLYDLLASEARLTSFIAIAKGDAPVSHWFHLGRALTPVGRDSVLVSWSGSMFEYLMPSLIMQVPEGSLLDQTCRLVVQRQIAYGAERGVPWGVSESGYNVRDIAMTYQYSTFGIPGLGLRRQAGDDLVIAPYATALAAMIDPSAAARNFRQLAAAGAAGEFGFREALDYTPARLPVGADVAVVRSYMAHHQGMALVGLADALLDDPMPRRFHSEPFVRASELLLQERTPRDVAVARPQIEEAPLIRDPHQPVVPLARRFLSPHSATPRTHLLSNGRYVVMLNAAGSGYSRWDDLAVTRWRADTTSDLAGTHIYLRDLATDAVWSAGFQPTAVEPDSYSVAFSDDRAEYVRRDGSVTTRLEVVVSPESAAETRRITLTNDSLRSREIEVTSYAEVVLATQAADEAHPAFSNLFVETERLADRAALLATRRRRAAEEAPIWLGHVLAVNGETVGPLQWETDRARFIGRARSVRTPAAIADGAPLSNTTGPVIDPIVSLRRRVRLRPGGRATLTFTTIVAASREEVLDLAERFSEPAAFERASDLAWTQAQVQLHHLGISAVEAQLFQTLATSLIYPARYLRASAAHLARPNGGPPSLWAHGISGDVPIVVVQIDDSEGIALVRQLLRAHEYWRAKHLVVDLVILNEHGLSYQQDLQLQLETLARASQAAPSPDGRNAPGRIFVLRADRIAPDRDALLAAARALLSDRRGTLAEQVTRAQRQPSEAPRVPPFPADSRGTARELPLPPLQFSNELGGFSADGREYMVVLTDRESTPAPWINVVGNPEFGFQVSESGAGYTWSVNSRENQLTPWSNDPVTDPPGEVLYVRDEESGAFWTPTALPMRLAGRRYVARHGAGYSRFAHESHGITLELLQFVPTEGSVKISRLTITNRSRTPRRLTVTSYTEWVLGVSRAESAPFVVTEVDPITGAILATNSWNSDFRGRVAFADLCGVQTAWTGDRGEFIGRQGTLERPAALDAGARLSGSVGGGFDPCAVLQAPLTLAPGASQTITLLLGEAADRDAASQLVQRFRTADHEALLRQVDAQWDQILGTTQVDTPDPAMNLMLNRWLLYQTVACRIWARSAFYQASGAYGFRDQLQDVMAVTVARPDITRAQLLRAAARQFPEGDVQHWWHPVTGRGVRTRVSDDLLWLPYVATHYLAVTGDLAILDERVPLLEGARLHPGELERYFEPSISDEKISFYEHNVRAIDRALQVGNGVHGLPLIGSGDWNDGMNRVGYQGRGESVWLGWFLARVLQDWAPVVAARGDTARAATWMQQVHALTDALAREGWDGHWFRRAFFDDGTPLGSAVNDECQIDAIAQSWSVLSGIADQGHAREAMESLDQDLVDRLAHLHRVLTPAFDHTALDPGYIKGYPPGIRENGGQYTHAAAWSIVAWTMLGDGDRATELFGLLNPIRHAATREGMELYRVEPYVVAGDVYSAPPHTGRGGWTWYTGSAGWLYRAGIESILGFTLRGDRLIIDPCIPTAWPGFTLTYQHRTARYIVAVENPEKCSRGVALLEVDGNPVDPVNGIALVDDGGVHAVRVVLGVGPS